MKIQSLGVKGLYKLVAKTKHKNIDKAFKANKL